eukprot:11206269-Lingulodinium_polyedra.AAC.1
MLRRWRASGHRGGAQISERHRKSTRTEDTNRGRRWMGLWKQFLTLGKNPNVVRQHDWGI